MKQKLAVLVAAKLQLWSTVCQPFTGENPPNDRAAARACMLVQMDLDELVKRIDLLDQDNSDRIVSNEVRTKETK